MKVVFACVFAPQPVWKTCGKYRPVEDNFSSARFSTALHNLILIAPAEKWITFCQLAANSALTVPQLPRRLCKSLRFHRSKTTFN
jgi:hypothetical protein